MAEVRLQTSNDGIFKGDDFTLDSIFDIKKDELEGDPASDRG